MSDTKSLVVRIDAHTHNEAVVYTATHRDVTLADLVTEGLNLALAKRQAADVDGQRLELEW